MAEQNHAQRFVELARALDIVGGKWPGKSRDFPIATILADEEVATLKQYLKYWLRYDLSMNGSVLQRAAFAVETRVTSLGNEHLVIKHKSEYRRELPKELREALKALDAGISTKINPRWIAAYVNGVRPDESMPGWEFFECSHRCVEEGLTSYSKKRKAAGMVFEACIDFRCLHWESKGVNQGRANPACRKMCHCGCNRGVCEANQVHGPQCR